MLRLLLLVLVFTGQLRAGVVNSPNSYPIAKMNTRGDFILAGDWRLMTFWQDRFYSLPIASSSQDEFTAGISETTDSKAQAIICNGMRAWEFKARRTPKQPAGSFEEIDHGLKAPIKCAMSANGEWTIFSPTSALLYDSNQHTVALDTASNQFWLDYLEDTLLIMSSKKQAWTYDGEKIESIPFPSKSFGLKSRFYANQKEVFILSDYKIERIQYSRSSGKLVFAPAENISLSACEDSQICGFSLARDGSWLLTGYWGSYLGQASNYQRLPVLLETGKLGASAVAHNYATGSFIFSGAFDGDWGKLTELSKQKKLSFKGSWQPSFDRMLLDQTWKEQIALQIAMTQAKQLGLEADKVKIGVVDSGASPNHTSFLLRLTQKKAETPNGLDDDENGYVDDAIGYDFIQEIASIEDKYGHGSHVAALLAADTSDKKSFSVSPNAELVVARALDQSGKSNSIDLARAIRYLADEGSELINLSWGGGSSSLALKDAISYAQDKGAWIFTSSGNDSVDLDNYPQVPGIYPGVVIVGSVDGSGRVSRFSNFGAEATDFFAPGENIYSAYLGNEIKSLSGTSMASPIAVSSFAWLLGISKKLYPDLEDHQNLVFESLCRSAKTMANRSRCGLIQLDQALDALLDTNR